ncbi:MAG: DUF1175 domain-containing protein [Acidobacteria bacterium]|nr:DUF1175 domain-containing protein [Acidobacteriota bacterium]
MTGRWPGRLALAAVCCALAAWAAGSSWRADSAPVVLLLQTDTAELPADGFSTAHLWLHAAGDNRLPPGTTIQIREGARRARLESLTHGGGGWAVILRAGILPGPVEVEARAPGVVPARLRLETKLAASDRYGDGTPDFLRLDDADRQAFRGWFTFLAEGQFFRAPDELRAEIDDCAALLRFAYREALREHSSEWASALRLEGLPPGVPVSKYAYPYTPLGASLFRVKPGAFRADDAANGAFAQFADAETLRKLNTHFVSRSLRDARPGDLLFFRQLEQDLPYHTMIYLGPSQFEDSRERFIIYHTGPLEGGKGEIRRPSVEELVRHPSPRWRPQPGNPNFFGVYRWNILREAD